MEKIKKWNRTLLEMAAGMLAYGILCQLALVWLVKDKAGCSLGLWIGVAMAFAAALHMYRSLDKAFSGPEAAAAKYMIRANLLRYFAIVLIFGILLYTGAANPLAAFVGILGLKVSAYLQPLAHKLTNRIFHETDPIPQPLAEEEPQEE